MNPDGISYLDLGDAYLRGDWANAANSYWSPMYAWILGSANRIFHPSVWWQFPLAHLVNLAIFLFALYCFRYLVRAFLQASTEPPSTLPATTFGLPNWSLWSISYALF